MRSDFASEGENYPAQAQNLATETESKAADDCHPLLLLNRLRPVKHNHIATPGDQKAAALLGKLWSEFLLLLLELVELHFDKFVMFEHLIQSGEELRAQTFFAYLQHGFEALSLGFEISDLRVGERIHGSKLRKSAEEATRKPHGARSRLPVKTQLPPCIHWVLPLSTLNTNMAKALSKSQIAASLAETVGLTKKQAVWVPENPSPQKMQF